MNLTLTTKTMSEKETIKMVKLINKLYPNVAMPLKEWKRRHKEWGK